jgi:hypothetical protein
MLLYNGGKNKDSATPAIGNATIGYDCSTSKLCVAAYLSNQTYFEENDCKVVESDTSSWVSIGTGDNKYKRTTSGASFMYVKTPGTDRTIGKLCRRLY